MANLPIWSHRWLLNYETLLSSLIKTFSSSSAPSWHILKYREQRFGQKTFWPKNVLTQKMFRPKNVGALKKYWPKNVLALKTFWLNKMFWPKKCFRHICTFLRWEIKIYCSSQRATAAINKFWKYNWVSHYFRLYSRNALINCPEKVYSAKNVSTNLNF